MGPNIKPIPKFSPIGNNFNAKVMISLEDNITTDHIMPAGAKVLPYRSNIEKISEFVFSNIRHLNCKIIIITPACGHMLLLESTFNFFIGD